MSRFLRQLLEKPLSALFLIAIFLPLLGQLTSRRSEIEENEKIEARKYNPKPTLQFGGETLKKYPEQFEKYYGDHFGFRLPLVRLNAFIAYNFFNRSPNKNILLGLKGWFYPVHGPRRVQEGQSGPVKPVSYLSDYMGLVPFSKKALQRWKKVLEERMYYLKEQGIPFVFAIAPAKHQIYPENMPVVFKFLKGESRIEQLNKYLQENSDLTIVDLRKHLNECKGNSAERDLYYKTDGHWNYYGSFRVYQAIANAADKLLSNVNFSPMSLDQYQIKINKKWHHEGFSNRMGMIVTDWYPNLVPQKNNPTFGVKRVKAQIMDQAGKKAKYEIVKSPKGGPLEHLFLFGDSFLQKTLLYFSAHAKQTTFSRQILDFPIHIFNTETKPQLVIEEIYQGYIFKNPPKNPNVIKKAYSRAMEREKNRVKSLNL